MEEKIYHNNGRSVPIGTIEAHGSDIIPDGWLLCNGSSLSTTIYKDLFSIIGYSYGGSGGSFTIPDLRDRFPKGKAISGESLGQSGGNNSMIHCHGLTTNICVCDHSSLAINAESGHTHTEQFSSSITGQPSYSWYHDHTFQVPTNHYVYQPNFPVYTHSHAAQGLCSLPGYDTNTFSNVFSDNCDSGRTLDYTRAPYSYWMVCYHMYWKSWYTPWSYFDDDLICYGTSNFGITAICGSATNTDVTICYSSGWDISGHSASSPNVGANYACICLAVPLTINNPSVTTTAGTSHNHSFTQNISSHCVINNSICSCCFTIDNRPEFQIINYIIKY